MFRERRSGILLHITSLPSRFGMGDMGPEAYRFADWLRSAGQGLWQTLPLSPVTAAAHFSPYSSPSAFAGNPLLISPELLRDIGLLDEADLDAEPDNLPMHRVDFRRARKFRVALLDLACRRFSRQLPDADFDRFCRDNALWLDDHAIFTAFRHYYGARDWPHWPAPLRDRKPKAMKTLAATLDEEVLCARIQQYFFHGQWLALKRYCHKLGLQLLGDLPIYVAYDSADVWAHPQLFQLDSSKRLTAVSGIPPTDDVPGGQLWGMPLYDWQRHEETGFAWWIQRIQENLNLYDWLRIDHFLGMANYWRIPADSMNPKKGEWVAGPRDKLFRALYSHFAALPLIAEDVGFVTLEARQIMQRYQLPGLNIVLDAFSRPAGENPFAPHNHLDNSLVCTGTHDFNTARGWFEHQAGKAERMQFFDYIGRKVSAEQAPWEMIRLALTSVGRVAIIPMQDVLSLGREARMNRPGTSRGNWVWRMLPDQANEATAERLRQLTFLTGRCT